MPTFRRRPAALCCALIIASVPAVGCGGGDDEEARDLIEKAFAEPLDGAKLTLDVEFEAKGLEGLSEPLRINVTGPFADGEDGGLPRIDWNVSVRTGARPFEARLVSTAENIFVGLGGTNYEAGEQATRQINEQLRAADRQNDERDLGELGVDPQEWIEDGDVEDDEEVAGVQTRHVSGALDVERLLGDLNELSERTAGEVAGQRAPTLTEDQRNRVAEIVEDPRFDVYIGKEDGIVRRISADLEFDVPEEDREGLGGLESGSLRFSIELGEVNRPQRFEPLPDARPIAELAQQIAPLLGGLGGGGASGGQAAPQEGAAPEPGSPPAQEGPRGPAGREQFEQYAQCIENARSSQDLDACAALIR